MRSGIQVEPDDGPRRTLKVILGNMGRHWNILRWEEYNLSYVLYLKYNHPGCSMDNRQ